MARRGVAFILRVGLGLPLGFGAAARAQPASAPSTTPSAPPRVRPASAVSSSQSVPPRVMPAPGLLVPPRSSPAEAAAFRQKKDDYTRYTHEHDRAMRLAETSRGIVSLRDGRGFWEGELRRNASLQQRYPQGYGHMLDEMYRLYGSQGGTAANVAAVTAIAPPCTNAWDMYRPTGAALSKSRSMSVPQPGK